MNLLKVSELVWVNIEDISRVEWATWAPVIIMKSQARVPATLFGMPEIENVPGSPATVAEINSCLDQLIGALERAR